MNSLHINILQDVKIAYPTLTDSVAYTKGQFGTQGGTMINGKCFTTRQLLALSQEGT
jgi:hypothetical protein